jgi:hypothetical protein
MVEIHGGGGDDPDGRAEGEVTDTDPRDALARRIDRHDPALAALLAEWDAREARPYRPVGPVSWLLWRLFGVRWHTDVGDA